MSQGIYDARNKLRRTHAGCCISKGGESKEDDDEFGEHGDKNGQRSVKITIREEGTGPCGEREVKGGK